MRNSLHAAPQIAVAHPSAAGHADGADGPFVLYFESLFPTGRHFAFPCDHRGQVDLDAMADRIRNNYLYARAMIGREVSWPSVRVTPGLPSPAGDSTCGSGRTISGSRRSPGFRTDAANCLPA